MLMVPWLCRPMMSPAKASSAAARSAGHEGQRVGDAHLLAEAHVVQPHAAAVLARAQAHEGDAVAMPRIHVRLDLEHEAGELAPRRLDLALARRARQRRRARASTKSASSSSTPKLLIAEPKNTGVCLPAQVGVDVERLRSRPRTSSISSSKRRAHVAEELARLGAVQAVDDRGSSPRAPRARRPRRRRCGLRAGDRCRAARGPCRSAR